MTLRAGKHRHHPHSPLPRPIPPHRHAGGAPGNRCNYGQRFGGWHLACRHRWFGPAAIRFRGSRSPTAGPFAGSS
eukprot:scaffold6774_cov202-Prasinococcus_capsulatus_cf.AAC.1